MLYNINGKFNRITTKGLTMNDHDTSIWFMISYNTKVIYSSLISSNSTWEYVLFVIKLKSNENNINITIIEVWNYVQFIKRVKPLMQ